LGSDLLSRNTKVDKSITIRAIKKIFVQVSISPVCVRLTVKGVDFARKLLKKDTKR
jgi:hypothetical protein